MLRLFISNTHTHTHTYDIVATAVSAFVVNMLNRFNKISKY